MEGRRVSFRYADYSASSNTATTPVLAWEGELWSNCRVAAATRRQRLRDRPTSTAFIQVSLIKS